MRQISAPHLRTTATTIVLAHLVLGLVWVTANATQPSDLTAIAPQSNTTQNRLALVIGNTAYQNASHLKNPVNDANGIANKLKRLGFSVDLGLDLNEEAFRKTIRKFAEKLNENDVALFYYSGHAIQVDGTNYMLPTDARLESSNALELQGINLDQTIRIIEGGSGTRLIILDACRNNPFERTRGVGDSVSTQEGKVRGFRAIAGLARIEARAGTHIEYATAPGEVAMDGSGETSPFAQAIIELIDTPGWPVERLFREVRKRVLALTNGRQVTWSSSSLVQAFSFAPGVNPLQADAEAVFTSPNLDPGNVIVDNTLKGKLAGGAFTIGKIPASMRGDEARLETETDRLRTGAYTIQQDGRLFRVWYENRRLLALPDPYKKSYAIIVAVGEYDKTLKELYPDLKNIQQDAERFGQVLIKLGFPKENMIELYGKAATSANIHGALQMFWAGGKYANADRVVFYFGGHGNHLEMGNYLSTKSEDKRTVGYLVTADFDVEHPMASSFLFDDIRAKHFSLMTARQVLFLIDSCSSGLALGTFAETRPTLAELEGAFVKLSEWHAEAALNGRSILVASTGDRRALYENGGLFTKSLLKGLGEGKADINRNGVISFDELEMYVREFVIAEARLGGFEQRPSSFSVGGKMMFLAPN
jgi:uncharacterized caspase-like protein